MARVVEIFIVVNAACGIATFVIAKGLLKKAKRKIAGEEGGDSDEVAGRPR